MANDLTDSLITAFLYLGATAMEKEVKLIHVASFFHLMSVATAIAIKSEDSSFCCFIWRGEGEVLLYKKGIRPMDVCVTLRSAALNDMDNYCKRGSYINFFLCFLWML